VTSLVSGTLRNRFIDNSAGREFLCQDFSSSLCAGEQNLNVLQAGLLLECLDDRFGDVIFGLHIDLQVVTAHALSGCGPYGCDSRAANVAGVMVNLEECFEECVRAVCLVKMIQS
jgi:hypothetical protein